MSIINRFLLLLLSLAGTGVSLSILGAVLGLLPEQVWLGQLRLALARHETVIIAVLLLLISLKLLLAVFGRIQAAGTSKGEYVISSSPQGEVRIALEAIRNLVDQLSRETHGVRDAKVNVMVRKGKAFDALELKLRLVIGREADVTKLSAALTTTIQQRLEQVMALSDVPVNIVVTNVTDEAPVKKHRVV